MNAHESKLPWGIRGPLMKAACVSQARSDAMVFALKVDGDIDAIRAEIEDRESTLHELLNSTSFGESNPMAPGASPRIYMDAYLAGLREAIEMIFLRQ